ncbi:DUF6263 family protein [Planctomicrobium sp. SH668]|uniref:DUF6263 family protein n=1 Tax=Planctomicrobium sp. SH668 TaxID=3448126 RepID=UPI003F5AEBD1
MISSRSQFTAHDVLKMFIFSCLATLLTASSTFADDNATYLLRYKFEPDQTVRYNVKLEDSYKIQVGLDTDEPYSKQTSVKNYVVRKVEADGSGILELSIESVDLEIFQNNESYHYNSLVDLDPKDQPVFEAMANLIGRPHLQIQMSTRGIVTAFNPLTPGDQVPDNPGQVAFDVLLHLPEEAVKINDSWKEDFELRIPLADSTLRKTIKMQRRYTLKSVEGDLATIDIQTRVLSPLDSAAEEIHFLRRKPAGTVVLDLDKGILVSKSLKQDNQVSGFEQGASLMHFQQEISETLHEDQSKYFPKTR